MVAEMGMEMDGGGGLTWYSGNAFINKVDLRAGAGAFDIVTLARVVMPETLAV